MFARLLRLLPILFALCALFADASASPMSPELLERLKQEGRLQEVVSRLNAARVDGYFESDLLSLEKSRARRLAGDVDTVRVPVILAEFSDHLHTSFNAGLGPQQYDSILFSWGKVPTGSMTEFYWENSYGTFYLTGDVVGWFEMPQTYAYYVNGQNGFGPCPRCAMQMVADAIYEANWALDYSQYDRDNNGYVDGVFVVFAGYGAEQSGNVNDIWSHRSSAPAQYFDGKWVSAYSVEPQVRYSNRITDIGVFCHEFGHVLGLPDLYDTDYTSSGVGNWSLMSGGSWNGGGHTPAHFDAWCKKKLGFLTETLVTGNIDDVPISRVEDTPVAYRLWKEGQLGSQYFLVENRQQVLFDAALPGNGLLIWHIDETRPGNTDETHPKVALEQADGLFNLEHGAGGGDPGDPWPGSYNKREFSEFSTPNSKDYTGAMTEVAVFNVSNSDNLMTAHMEVVFGRPFLQNAQYDFTDAQGNQNGHPDPGETDIQLVVTLDNLGADALGLTVQASATDPEIVFSHAGATIGDVLRGQFGSNAADPIVFSVDPNFPPTIVYFTFTFSANGGAFTDAETLRVNVGPAQFLLVDGQPADTLNYARYYTRVLDSLRSPHVIWSRGAQSSPPADTLGSYPVAIWFTGDHRADVLSSTDVANLKTFLNAGGRLFLTGQDIAQDLADDADSTFLRDYLHVRFIPGDPLWYADGVPGDPIGDGHLVPIGGPGGAANQSSPDIIQPIDALAKTAYTYYFSTDAAGVHVATGNYKVVFLAFGCEGIGDGLGDTRRAEVFERVFTWLNGTSYIPGDVNSDQTVNPADVVHLVNHVYKSAPPPTVPNSGDVNADCTINPLDVVMLVNYVYKSQGQLQPGCVE